MVCRLVGGMTRPGAHTVRTLVYSTLAFVCVAVGSIVAAVWGLRTDSFDQATRHSGEVAILLAEKTNQFIRSIDLVLADVQNQVSREEPSSAPDLRARVDSHTTYLLLRQRLTRLPQAEFLDIIDADGGIINSSRAWPPVSSRLAHCTALAIAPTDPLAITSSEGRLYFQKALRGSNNTIVGYACLGVHVRYFEEVYEFPASHSLALTDLDGKVLAGHPGELDRSGDMPLRVSAAAENSGESEWHRSQDGREFLVAVRRLKNYPLKVAVILSKADALRVRLEIHG